MEGKANRGDNEDKGGKEEKEDEVDEEDKEDKEDIEGGCLQDCEPPCPAYHKLGQVQVMVFRSLMY